MSSIQVKNIYWMITYALNVIDDKGIKSISTETFENIYDLCASLMSLALSKQVKRGLDKSYIVKINDLPCVKGKILIKENLLSSNYKSKIFCEYDEYNENSYLNKIVKTACVYLLKSNKIIDKKRAIKLKRYLLYLSNVDTINIKLINWNRINFNKNNVSYKVLVNISYLIINGLLASNENGNINFRKFIDPRKMSALYEKFILGYYKYHHPSLLKGACKIDWNVEENEKLLPIMKTDIMLYNKVTDKTLIIDAKYYDSIFQYNKKYDSKSFHSDNLYQMYAYVKNKDIHKTGKVSGLLLYGHAKGDPEVESSFNLDGNEISITNIDLNKDFDAIRKKLESIIIDL